MSAVTEKEASHILCPQTQVAVTPAGDVITNLGLASNDISQCTCIGSYCMLWQWMNPSLVEREPDKARGYCGLGGKP